MHFSLYFHFLDLMYTYLPKSVLLTVYYAFFSAHATYSCQVWGQNLLKSWIPKLQKTALCLLTFSDYKHPSKPIFHQLGILNIVDYLKFCNVCLVHQILNNVSISDISSTLNINHQQIHHSTWGSSIKILKRPTVRTTRFGELYQLPVHTKLECTTKYINTIWLGFTKIWNT